MAEIQTQMAEISKNINDKFMPKINEILDKNQQKRLHEIAIQVGRSPRLEDADVVKTSASRRTSRQDQVDRQGFFRQNLRALPRDADRSERMAKMAELR